MTQPIYVRLAQKIGDGLGPPGSVLPSEADLMSSHKATRGTIRRALDLLESQGLIVSSQGKPRTVRDSRRWSWNMSQWELNHKDYDVDAWAHSIKEQGGQPGSNLQIVSEIVPEDIAPLLAVETGTAVQARHRIRSVDGEPHQLCDSYFPPWVTDQAIWWQPGDLAAPGGLLAATGHQQERWEDVLTCRMPTPDEASNLNMNTGTPLIVHQRVGYDEDNRPVRAMVTRMPADRVEITYGVKVNP